MDPKPELERNPGFFQDLAQFMLQQRKWWLAPLVVVLLLMGMLLVLGGSSVAPFIYTLF